MCLTLRWVYSSKVAHSQDWSGINVHFDIQADTVRSELCVLKRNKINQQRVHLL